MRLFSRVGVFFDEAFTRVRFPDSGTRHESKQNFRKVDILLLDVEPYGNFEFEFNTIKEQSCSESSSDTGLVESEGKGISSPLPCY